MGEADDCSDYPLIRSKPDHYAQLQRGDVRPQIGPDGKPGCAIEPVAWVELVCYNSLTYQKAMRLIAGDTRRG